MSSVSLINSATDIPGEISLESEGMDPGETAAANSAAINRALTKTLNNGGGLISLTKPGVYSITADNFTPTANTFVMFGNGVQFKIGTYAQKTLNSLSQIAGLQPKTGIDINPDVPIIVMGGDHPYKQWWGTNGKNGMAQAYLDRGIKPYVAINYDTDTALSSAGSIAYPGSSVDSLTWSDLRDLQALGVEVDSHGAHHFQDNSAANIGITVSYSGVAAAPTMQVTSTGVVLVGNGGAENVTLLFATYPTMTTLAAAISATPSWSCRVAEALTGNEASGNLLVVAARNIKAATGNGNFAAGGGIALITTATSITRAYVWVQGNVVEVYVDGVKKYSFDMTTYTTMSTLVAQMTAAMAGDTFTIKQCNTTRFGVTGSNWQRGDELSTNLRRGVYLQPQNGYLVIPAGLPHRYIQQRNITKVVEVAAANGVTIEHFQSPGSDYYPHLHRGIRGIKSFRANRQIRVISPVQSLICTEPQGWFTHKEMNNSTGGYTLAATQAAVNALADSPGYALTTLIHRVLPDGTSNYQFIIPGGDTYNDQVESDFIALLDRVQTLIRAGQLIAMTPAEYRLAKRKVPAPNNLLFNPLLKNDGTNLLNVTNNGGITVPGWNLNTPNTTFSAFAIANGEISAVGTATTSTDFLYQEVQLERGKTYEFGCEIETSNVSSGSGVYIGFARARGKFSDWIYQGQPGGAASGTIMGTARSLGASASGNNSLTLLSCQLTVPPAGQIRPPFAVSVAGPYNFTSTPAQIAFNAHNLGVLQINVAGATPTATTTDEVVTAINAAVAASALYPAEYRNCARAVQGKVVVSLPYVNTFVDPNSTSQSLQILAGATNSATVTLFGGLVYEPGSYAEDFDQDAHAIYRMHMNTSIVGNLKVRNLYLQEVKWA